MEGTPVSTTRLGLRLAQLRAKRDMTQQELADTVGVSRPYISMIENGTRDPWDDPVLVGRLARALQVDVTTLVGRHQHGEHAIYEAVPAIRAALDGDLPDRVEGPGPIRGLLAETVRAWSWGDYPLIAFALPELLAATLAADLDEDTIEALVGACVVGSVVTADTGWLDLSARLADRAETVAAASRRPAVRAAASYAKARSLHAAGSHRRAVAVATNAARAAQAGGDATWPGLLWLLAGLGAADLGDPRLVRDCLHHAAA